MDVSGVCLVSSLVCAALVLITRREERDAAMSPRRRSCTALTHARTRLCICGPIVPLDAPHVRSRFIGASLGAYYCLNAVARYRRGVGVPASARTAFASRNLGNGRAGFVSRVIRCTFDCWSLAGASCA